MSTTRERRSARCRQGRYAERRRRRDAHNHRMVGRQVLAFLPAVPVVLPLVRVVVADVETRASVEVLRVVLECEQKHRYAHNIAHRGARDCPPLRVGRAVQMALHGPVAMGTTCCSGVEVLRGTVEVDPDLPPDAVEGFGG